MKKFLDENFLLQNETSQRLYHEYAKEMPIIDYHCHLPPNEISDDVNFKNLTQIWLYGDHYKWRAMRTNGVDEKYCTGDASDIEKFEKWAETVPFTMRNPLYHWTHMELKRYFGIDRLLEPSSAQDIFEETKEKLQQPDFSVRSLLNRSKVETVCTTDDPIDSLEYHKKIREQDVATKVLPTWRPDKAMAVDAPESYNEYVDKLAVAADLEINNYNDLLFALQKRHDFFHEQGCRLSDHGIETIFAADYTESEVSKTFDKIRAGNTLREDEVAKFKTAMLVQFAFMDHEKGWTQQFHVGAMRNNNSRMFQKLGADSGFDSIGDFPQGRAMARFFDWLDKNDQLAKTILYNLNPADNYLIGTMIGCFNDGSVAGKMQFGSGWWFNDQKEGIEAQLNALSNLGLVSRFVGMLTDSRSFLSFPRHEYFRRVLCNVFGTDVENGELPNDIQWIGKIIQNICYYNAKEYFGF